MHILKDNGKLSMKFFKIFRLRGSKIVKTKHCFSSKSYIFDTLLFGFDSMGLFTRISIHILFFFLLLMMIDGWHLRIVSHISSHLEILVQKVANIRIDALSGDIALILPSVVLES
jgi:hypothetical protein